MALASGSTKTPSSPVIRSLVRSMKACERRTIYSFFCRSTALEPVSVGAEAIARRCLVRASCSPSGDRLLPRPGQAALEFGTHEAMRLHAFGAVAGRAALVHRSSPAAYAGSRLWNQVMMPSAR